MAVWWLVRSLASSGGACVEEAPDAGVDTEREVFGKVVWL